MSTSKRWSVRDSNPSPPACKPITRPNATGPRPTRRPWLSRFRGRCRTWTDTVRQPSARTALAPPLPERTTLGEGADASPGIVGSHQSRRRIHTAAQFVKSRRLQFRSLLLGGQVHASSSAPASTVAVLSFAGIRNVNSEPPPGIVSAVMLPLWAWATWRTIASPSPEPGMVRAAGAR